MAKDHYDPEAWKAWSPMAQYGNVKIDDSLHGRLHKCATCHKMILVEEKYNGVSHTMAQIAAHWDCLTPEQQAAARQHYGLTP